MSHIRFLQLKTVFKAWEEKTFVSKQVQASEVAFLYFFLNSSKKIRLKMRKYYLNTKINYN